MSDEQFILTPAGYEDLKNQLADFEARRAEVLPLYDAVDEDSGNLEGEEAGAFYDTRTRLEYIDERIGHLRYVLDRAIVSDEDPDPKRVDPGEEVVVWDVEEKKERIFTILDGEEAQMTYNRSNEDKRVVSSNSPVGQLLLGATIGDVIEVEVPDGTARYAVRRIHRPK